MTEPMDILVHDAQNASPHACAWRPLPGAPGTDVRVTLEPDYGLNYFDNDCFAGTLYPITRVYERSSRPSECDGAARKMRNSSGDPYWWQPPKELRHDAAGLAAAEKRARGWLNDDWTYVVVVVEVRRPPCPHCGERKVDGTALGGVESDAGVYFHEVITDALSELQPKEEPTCSSVA